MRKRTLTEKEFNFGSCQTHELMMCWSYEFAREATKYGITKIIDDYRANRPKQNQKDYWRDFRFDKSDPSIPSISVWLPPGFPHTPFLNLDIKYRTDPYQGAYKKFLYRIPSPVRFNISHDKSSVNWSPNPTTFYIDWQSDISDDEYVKYFKSCLEARPKDKIFLDKKHGNFRNKTREADLRKLGAYRLLEQHGSVKAAKDYLKKITTKYMPYSAKSNWSEAKSSVTSIIKSYFGGS